MTVTADGYAVGGRAVAGHVCWVVDDPSTYIDVAAGLLAEGAQAGDKLFAFGPEGETLAALAPHVAVAADPRTAFLGGGPLDPEAMFDMFREQSAQARAEGYRGLRLVADMDWLLPAGPSTADVVAFELLLDAVIGELDATVVCAYRPSSFDAATVDGSLCVHPHGFGHDEPPQFQLVAGESGTWRLSGEVDLAVAPTLAAGLAAAVRRGPCVVDVGALGFVDVAGLRVIAQAARAADGAVVLRGASPTLRRSWELSGFADVAPFVELAA